MRTEERGTINAERGVLQAGCVKETVGILRQKLLQEVVRLR